MAVDPDFRPNPQRSICVFGEISSETVSHLAPEILTLRAKSDSEPITVYINSNGGEIRALDHLISLLTSKGASSSSPRIITVAIGNAASAAANLLALGDYAIAYPKANIHFHGTR